MCALCGVLGGAEHWTDPAPRPGVFAPAASADGRRRGRMRSVIAANRILRHYGLSLADWQATALLLSTATGKTEIVADLSRLWGAAEKLTGRSFDPLEPSLIEKLETRHG